MSESIEINKMMEETIPRQIVHKLKISEIMLQMIQLPVSVSLWMLSISTSLSSTRGSMPGTCKEQNVRMCLSVSEYVTNLVVVVAEEVLVSGGRHQTEVGSYVPSVLPVNRSNRPNPGDLSQK